jgi:hypothetical protein
MSGNGCSGRAPAPPASEAGTGAEDNEHAIAQKLNVAVAATGRTHSGVSNLTRALCKASAIRLVRKRAQTARSSALLAGPFSWEIGLKASNMGETLALKVENVGSQFLSLQPAPSARTFSGKNENFRSGSFLRVKLWIGNVGSPPQHLCSPFFRSSDLRLGDINPKSKPLADDRFTPESGQNSRHLGLSALCQ